jgi:hypothetical protein
MDPTYVVTGASPEGRVAGKEAVDVAVDYNSEHERQINRGSGAGYVVLRNACPIEKGRRLRVMVSSLTWTRRRELTAHCPIASYARPPREKGRSIRSKHGT